MKSYEQFIPLVSYRYAPSGDRWQINEERKVETRSRHWGMAYWEDAAGRHSAEFGVITESMPDFCGGLMVYSPFVNTYDEKGSWSDSWCNPGTMPNNEEFNTKWSTFDDSLAINLNTILEWDKDTVSIRRVVEDYLWKCIAAQVAGELLHHGKRGWMGADHTSGRITKLAKVMRGMGTFVATPVHDWKIDKIGDPISTSTRDSTNASVVGWWCEDGTEWHNSNSGNTVRWVSGGLQPTEDEGLIRDDSGYVRCSSCDEEYSREYHSDCPSCCCDEFYNDDYYDEDEGPRFLSGDFNYTQEVRKINTEFAHRARRFFWRNG
jgi:hypothetical protein